MIEDIFYYLKSKEFKPIEVNLSYLQVLQKEMDGFHYVINLLNLEDFYELEKSTYENILRQIRDKFGKRSANLKILTIILTGDMDKAKLLYDEQELLWLIDNKKMRLVIYENQPIDFLSVRKGIEKILERKKHIVETKIEDLREEYNVSKHTATVIGKFLFSITFFITLLNVLVYVGTSIGIFQSDQTTVWNALALNWEEIFFNGQWYRLLTYAYVHFNFNHIFNNMLLLIVLGMSLEQYLGKLRFTALYILTGLCSGVISACISLINMEYIKIGGASHAVYGVVGAIAYIVFVKKDSRIKISGNRMFLFLFLIIYNSFNAVGVDNVGHISGLIIGFLLSGLFLMGKGNKKGMR